MMKISTLCSTSFRLSTILLVLCFFNFPITRAASDSAYESFLQCLTQQTNSSDQQISNIVVTQTNSSYASVLRAYIRNARFNLSSTLKPTATSLYSFMTPFVSKSPRSAYLNYRDVDIGINHHGEDSYAEGKVYGEKYFNGNFDRLVKVKTMVDPENFFRNEQSIPTQPRSDSGVTPLLSSTTGSWKLIGGLLLCFFWRS
ncbi:hypothetical protein CUMW_008650 [Citrus unshiu]|nr:hypothetical protein CUMW_008650 [Citrus unshiu]